MITKQQIQEAAQKYAAESPSNDAGAFVDGAQWALKMLEPVHNEAANQLEAKYIVRVPGLEFDWRNIEEKYKWVAIDEDGGVYKYKEGPTAMRSHWCVNDGSACLIAQLTNGHAKANWRELIFERPK